MNIKYHAAAGVIGEIVVPSGGLFLLFSVLPDFPLLLNEIKLQTEDKKFDPMEVSDRAFFWYHTFHSLPVTAFLLSYSVPAGLAHLLHVVADWFTHTGRFAAMPFFPMLKYKIKFGREILK